jgi:hypothetical protein
MRTVADRSALARWFASVAAVSLLLTLLPPLTATADPVAVTIATFDFEGDSPAPKSVADGFAVSDMTVASGTLSYFNGNPGRAAATTGWNSDEQHFEFVVTPPTGGVDLGRLTFDEAASGTGPQAWTVFVVDDLDSDPVATEVGSGNETGTTSPLRFGSRSVELSTLETRTEPFSIRIRGTSASSGGGTWRIDNVTLTTTGDDGEPAPADLSLACSGPLTVTEGFGETDGAFVDGKAITASASDADGEVSFTVTAVDPEPAAGELLVSSDGTDAEIRFSAEVPGLDPRAADGPYRVTIEADDGTATDTCTVDVRVVPVLNIGELRGVVPDDADGRQHVSPFALGSPIFRPGAPVATIGVVTQRTLEENAQGNFDFEGFFVQSLSVDVDLAELDLDDLAFVDRLLADGDERTSDGLWVSTGTFPTVRPDTAGPTPPISQQYRAEPGDIVVLRGPIVEDFQQTVLQNPFVVDVVRAEDSGIDVATDIEVVEANPSDDVQQASVDWERIAGMQVEVPAGSLVVSGNDVFAPSTSEVWVIRDDHPVAQRDDPDARRVFRPYHPLAHPMVALTDSPRPSRTASTRTASGSCSGSFGVKATLRRTPPRWSPRCVQRGHGIADAVQGGLYYSFSKYQVMVDAQPMRGCAVPTPPVQSSPRSTASTRRPSTR